MDNKRALLLRLLENSQKEKEMAREDIAVIGVSGRYPQSPSLEEYWENLKEGKNCISEIPRDRWNHEEYTGTCYSKWGGFIEDVDKFDPLFFHISPREAEAMDPQERLFLEIAWAVLEDAGYTLDRLAVVNNEVGVFVGVMNCNYEWLSGNAHARGHCVEARSAYWSIANRVSYCFDFQGPSMAVDTACSSSLTAIHLACESLKRDECKYALAGGVNLILSPAQYQKLCGLGMLTADNRCKVFAQGADGFLDGEGVGALLLKTLDQARADNDHIYAVIKSTAVNAGGKTSGYTVPNPNAQAAVISSALEKAGINPRTIGYVEAHGTGTSLGDPIEIAGLTKAFSEYTREKNYCSIGSSKSNLGHLESAAGIAAVTKVLLQLKHGQLVPTLHCEPLNPKIDFEDSPFYVQQELVPWKKMVIVENGKNVEYPRRAGISSFGAGGANAHVVLEEYEASNKKFCGGPGGILPHFSKEPPGCRGPEELILLSARNIDRLRAYAGKMADYLEKYGRTLSLADIAYTLQSGREPMEERLAVVVSHINQLKEKLTQYSQSRAQRDEENIDNLFQGNQTRGKQGIKRFPSGEDRHELIKDLLDSKDLIQLAQLWVSAVDGVSWEIDWQLLYPGLTPRRISLPTYPFTRNYYWIAGVSKPADIFTPGDRRQDRFFPLVLRASPDFEEQKFNTRIGGSEFYILECVQGELTKKVLSGMVYLEMARIAAETAGYAKVQNMQHIAWAEPVPVTNNSMDMDIHLYPSSLLYPLRHLHEGEGEVEFEVSKNGREEQQEQRVVQAQGRVVYPTPVLPETVNNPMNEPIPVETLKKRCRYMIKGSECYRRCLEVGLKIDPGLQVIQTLYSSEAEVFAQLRIPRVLHKKFHAFGLHPALLEGVMQSLIILLSIGRAKACYFPFELEHLECYKANSPADTYYVHAVPRGNTSSQVRDSRLETFDIRLAAENGQTLVKMNHFSLRQWQ